MRVAFVLEQLLAPVPGGTGRFARELALAAAAVASPEDSIEGWTAWRANVGRGRLNGLGGPRRLALGRRALAEAWSRGVGPNPRGADLVHAPTLLMPPRRQAPIVVTIHDAVPWTHPETLTPRGVGWHHRMGQRAANDADLITVDTEAVAVQLEPASRSRRPCPGPGGRLEPRRATPTRAIAAVDWAYRTSYLAFVGTVEPRKGLDVLLDALSALDLPLRRGRPPRVGRCRPRSPRRGAGGWRTG